jgi:hypothetical protein
MSRAGVEQVLGKLMIDPDFREAVKNHGVSALASFDLTPEECEQVMLVEPDFEQAARTLERRVSKMTLPSPLRSY